MEVIMQSPDSGINQCSVQVYKALLNEVTEVAAKQLQASSDAQMTLFSREISIHKRCRSVSLSFRRSSRLALLACMLYK